MKKGARYLSTAALLAVTAAACDSQAHPAKQAYLDFESWPVTTPSQLDFAERFRPFRAVWSREYRNMSGEMRQDRVVVVAEELSWYGRPVISITYHDAGALDAPDSNARTTAVYLDARTLALVRATAPKSGTPEDYHVVAAREHGVVTTTVSTATGATETHELATDGPVFGGFNLEFFAWAGLRLEPDARARLHLYSPDEKGLVPSIVRVVRSEDVRLPDGEARRGWLIERPIPQPDNARMHHFRILDRPPYLVSRHVIDLDSGDTSFHLRLLEWEPLGVG